MMTEKEIKRAMERATAALDEHGELWVWKRKDRMEVALYSDYSLRQERLAREPGFLDVAICQADLDEYFERTMALGAYIHFVA